MTIYFHVAPSPGRHSNYIFLSPTFRIIVFVLQYSRICLIRHLKGIRKKWRIMQTGENSIIEACILYHGNTYTYIVLLFAVKYKFMTLWLNTTINSSALSGLLHLIQHQWCNWRGAGGATSPWQAKCKKWAPLKRFHELRNIKCFYKFWKSVGLDILNTEILYCRQWCV